MGEPLDRVPPHDLEAERAVLGCCLIDPEAVVEVAGRLTKEAFYRTAHCDIYAVMLDMQEKGEPIDIITLLDRMRSAGTLEGAGGQHYIIELDQSVPSSVNLSRYVAIVEEHAKRRLLIQGSTWAIRKVEDGMDPVTVADKLSTALEQLPTEGNVFMSFAEVLARAKDDESFLTGLTDLDDQTGGVMCGLNILSGASNVGKTTLGLQIIARALEAKHQSCIISYDQKLSGLAQIIWSAYAKTQIQDLHKTDKSYVHVAEWPLTFYRGLFELPRILSEMRGKAKEGVRFFLIDYLGLIVVDGDDKTPAKKQTAAEALKRLAHELDLFVILISRSTKIKSGDPPTLMNLEGEAGVGNAADQVWMLEAKDDPRQVFVHCVKSRQAAKGKVELLFVGNTHRFFDKEDGCESGKEATT